MPPEQRANAVKKQSATQILSPSDHAKASGIGTARRCCRTWIDLASTWLMLYFKDVARHRPAGSQATSTTTVAPTNGVALGIAVFCISVLYHGRVSRECTR